MCEKKKIYNNNDSTNNHKYIDFANKYLRKIRMHTDDITVRVATILTFGRPLHTPFCIFSSSGVFYNYSRSHTHNCEGYKAEITMGWLTQRGNVRTRWNLHHLERVLANEGAVLGMQGELPNLGSLRRCCHHLS